MPPVVTEAVSVTGVPQAAVVMGEPAALIARAVELETDVDPMVTGSGTVAVSAPEVPVMVAVVVPVCTELAAVSVRTPAVADETGFQLAVTPEGKPAMEKATVPLNPFTPTIPTVDFSVPPGNKVILPGAGASVNEGAVTVSWNVAVVVTEP